MDRRQELAAAAREAAQRLGTPMLSLREFIQETGFGEAAVYQHFPGWPELCREAGLKARSTSQRLTDDEVFAAMRDAFLKLGKVGTFRQFELHFRFSAGLLRRRNLKWKSALVAFRAWAQSHAPDFPYMDQLPNAVLPPPEAWPTVDGRALGALINFRAALHAPVNEGGVMVLFGMVAEDLGYVVETVAPGFPDCEAKRRIGGGRWQRVRIEFEFLSRNFRDHGHDSAGCELIVCWAHNWADCPVEVVELRTAIAALPVRGARRE